MPAPAFALVAGLVLTARAELSAEQAHSRRGHYFRCFEPSMHARAQALRAASYRAELQATARWQREQANKARARVGLDVHYDFGQGHPLLGHRMPDLDLVTADGPQRVFTLLHGHGQGGHALVWRTASHTLNSSEPTADSPRPRTLPVASLQR